MKHCKCCCCCKDQESPTPLPQLRRDTLHTLRAPFAAGWPAVVSAVTDAAIVLAELEWRGIVKTGER